MKPGLLAVWLLGSILSAGGPAGAETLDWNAAVREARAGNPSLRAARLQVEAARYQVTAAGSDFWPQVSANGSLNRSASQALDDSWGPVGPADYGTSYSFGGSASWSLFSGWSTVASRRRAKAQLTGQEQDYRQASRDLRWNLRQSFNDLVYGQRNLELLAQILERYNRQARYEEIQFKSGREPRWTWLKAQADAANVQWQITQARFDLENTRRALARLLGRDAEGGTGLIASGDLGGATPMADTGPDYAEMERRSPELLGQQASVDAGAASLTQSQSTRWPSLSARGSYSWSDSNVWPPDSSGWSAGLSLSYPLFAGGGQEAAISAARRSYEASLGQLADTRSQVRAALYQSWQGWVVAFVRMPVLRMQDDAAVERYKTVEALYQAGQATYLDFEQAEGILTQSQQSLLSAALNLAQSEADWTRAMGYTLEDEGGGAK